MSSFRILINAPYNKSHPISALKRFISWKIIRLCKLKNYKAVFWGNRIINIQYNSFHTMWLMYNYLLDWDEFNLIKNYVLDGDVVVDVGANIGIYSLWMSKYAGTHGKVFAFEPDSSNYFQLIENINLNNLGRYITPIQKAAGNVNGNISFTTGLDGENHIEKSNLHNVVDVPCVKLDDFFTENNIGHISYIKVDVEGFELDVLKGSIKYITERKIEIIQLEINQTILNSGTRIEELTDFLTKHDYELCRYCVVSNELKQVRYNEHLENYFAVFDIIKANKRLFSARKN